MRLLVVAASPPHNSFSLFLKRNKTPQPPGPGLPRQAPSVKTSTGSLLLMILLRSLRHRRERSAPRPFLAPGRRDQAHRLHALHRPDDVDAARDRPPARARLLHEGKALEPGAVRERRRIAAEHAAVQLEAQQSQPLAQPQQADELRVPWRRLVLAESEQ